MTAQIWPALVVPVLVAIVTVASLSRWAIGPLARLTGFATSQRDLVIAAADAERMQLAAVLHDGPLADVSLLVQRLDSSGDTENAELARTVATRLRDVGNDLRLPIVEDLGVGPALEWLVGRMARATGQAITLSIESPARPPAAVEGVAYRIAQEAVTNATRHGMPPIGVAYRTSEGAPTATTMELVVRDAGPGLAPETMEQAAVDGRLGLVLMRRRAASVGARLEVGTEAGAGTVVRLTWRPPQP